MSFGQVDRQEGGVLPTHVPERSSQLDAQVERVACVALRREST